jgi:NitT/TauT family transport system substrate-binding protein
MGMAKLISDNNENKTMDISLFGAPEDLSAALINGSLDAAAVPVNLAAVINKKTNGAYLVAAINTLGVLYIVENGNTLTSLSDLEGKTLYATGQGSTPEYMLNYILEKNGLTDKVTVEWKTEHSELATLVANGSVEYAMLPEPHVTTTLNKNESLRAAINLTEEWDKVSDGQAVQGCLVVSKKAIEDHKGVVDAFLAEYKASVNFVNNNIPEAASMIAEIGIVAAAPVAQKAIPRCNIVYIDGDDMIASLTDFYTVLYNANPASIGGTLPNESLYYKK